MSDGSAATVADCWMKSHSADVSRAMIAKTLNVNQLIDMSWRFGVTAANSEVSRVGTTFLQLHLVLDKEGERESVHLGAYHRCISTGCGGCSEVLWKALRCVVDCRAHPPSVLPVLG